MISLLDEVRLPHVESVHTNGASKNAFARQTESFVKGPVPCVWVQRCCKLANCGGQIAWVLVYLHGLNKEGEFTVPSKVLKAFGISHRTFDRILGQFEQKGLISVKRHNGRSPKIRLRLTVANAR